MANTLVVTIALDVTNVEHLKVLTLIGNMGLFAAAHNALGLEAPAPVSASPAPAQDAPAPEAPAKVYEAPEEDWECAWYVKGKFVNPSMTRGELKFVGKPGIRSVLNQRCKDAGAVWDADTKAYAFKSATAAKKFAESTSATVTPAQWQEHHDAQAAKKAAKEARKARKASK